jgi:phosphate transport system substrate-binding protein
MRTRIVLGHAIVIALTAAPAMAQITYVGSSTIGDKIMPEAARAFKAKTGVAIGDIQNQGSGVGIAMVARGDAALGGASRALTVAEKKSGVRYQIIGYDALVVFVNSSNRVKTLTRSELRDIFTGQVRNWKEVGGVAAPITVITVRVAERRGQSVEFQEHALEGRPYREDRREVDGGQTAQAAAIATEPHGVAVVSPAFAVPGMRPIALEGFEPSPENIRSGAYVLSRPLILVVPARPASDVRRFLEFMVGSEGQAIVARDFVSIR